jgi:hypothetical protein
MVMMSLEIQMIPTKKLVNQVKIGTFAVEFSLSSKIHLYSFFIKTQDQEDFSLSWLKVQKI